MSQQNHPTKPCKVNVFSVVTYFYCTPSYPPSPPQTTKLVKELQAMRKVCGRDPTHVQQDIQLRELRDFGSNVVQQLGSLGAKNPDLVPTMQLMFSQAGLPPAPSPSSSRASSVPSSARSSVSARYAGSIQHRPPPQKLWS